MLGFAESGLTFPKTPAGWHLEGMSAGRRHCVDSFSGAAPKAKVSTATGPELRFILSLSLTAYYAEWTKRTWYFAGEYFRVPYVATLQAGADSFVRPSDQRSWYPMVSYQMTKKLQLGTYYSHSIEKAAELLQRLGHFRAVQLQCELLREAGSAFPAGNGNRLLLWDQSGWIEAQHHHARRARWVHLLGDVMRVQVVSRAPLLVIVILFACTILHAQNVTIIVNRSLPFFPDYEDTVARHLHRGALTI